GSVLPKALGVIERELDQGADPFQAAVQVVKLAGLPAAAAGLRAHQQATDAEQIIGVRVEERLDQKRAEHQQYRSPTAAVLDSMNPAKLRQRDAADPKAARAEVLAEIEERLNGDASPSAAGC